MRDFQTRAVIVEFDVTAAMRDGTVLRADVYRPNAEVETWPVLLCRTPYGKRVLAETDWNGVDPVMAASRGFIVVIQDTRGRFSSDGSWDPLLHEAEDGADSVEWAAKLPGSNGCVGMFGGSYCGNTQWQAASRRPPALHAISPFLTWADEDDGLFRRGGALELGLVLPWSLMTGADDLVRRHAGDDRDLEEMVGALTDEMDALETRGYWELPVGRESVLARHDVRDLGTLRLSPVRDPHGASSSTSSVGAGIPSLNVGGWHDLFLQGTLDNFMKAQEQGTESQLIIGPWTHSDFLDPVGDLSYGVLSSRDSPAVHPAGSWLDTHLAWFAKQLGSGEDASVEAGPGVRIFVMGRNGWRDEASWPPARVHEVDWFLTSNAGLSLVPPEGADAPLSFIYDPTNPVPTVGGNILMSSAFRAGPLDQRPIESRQDVLVFTSDPLDEDLEVTGRVRASLAVQSSAPSTDWVVRLCDVYPDGRSVNVCDGILRIDSATDLQRIDVDLWSTSMVFLEGHRLRVHVTSSSFPRWDRNLNTGQQLSRAHSTAQQELRTDSEHPSWIVLPMAP